MKYLLEIETDSDQVTFAEEVLGTLSFVKKVTLVTDENRKTLADIFGKFNWDVDGLEYQRAVRDEWG